MQFKKFQNKYILRIDKGEEIVQTLTDFCTKNKIKLGTVSGLGASNRLTIGLFEADSKEYISRELTGDFEIAPLLGNISTMDGKTYLHIHANVGGHQNQAFAGHLNSAIVSATFEAIIEVIDGEIDRKFSEEIGLNLMKFKDEK